MLFLADPPYLFTDVKTYINLYKSKGVKAPKQRQMPERRFIGDAPEVQ
jgi:hypothetical protein